MKRKRENGCLFVCCNKEYIWNEREKKVFSLLMTVNALLKPVCRLSCAGQRPKAGSVALGPVDNAPRWLHTSPAQRTPPGGIGRSLFLFQAAVVQHRAEHLSSSDVPHDQEERLLGLNHLAQFQDIGVIQGLMLWTLRNSLCGLEGLCGLVN